ncbi:MAG TPA: hypothetical protein PKD66_15055, partial [Azonexus sp.]|nr:hypothetical protein [Azonexus sp.]
MTPFNRAFLQFFAPLAVTIGLGTTFSTVHFPDIFWGWRLACATSLVLLCVWLASSLARRIQAATDKEIHIRQALLTSEERLRSLGDNLPGTYIYQCSRRGDKALHFDYISSGVTRIHGYEPEEI